VRDDFSKLMYAQTEKEGRAAYEAFLSKWRKSCESVAKSLEEAGEELLTFFRYPKSQWKSLRTTNVIERLHEEFRRRVKTQSSLPNETAILILLYGLLAAGFVAEVVHGAALREEHIQTRP
jgi:transposase-like protein